MKRAHIDASPDIRDIGEALNILMEKKLSASRRELLWSYQAIDVSMVYTMLEIR